MKKNGLFSKKLLITIFILVCILTICIFSIQYIHKINNEKQEKILFDEINSMYSSKKIENTVKTNGKFAVIEVAIKEYYSEYINRSKELMDIYSQNLLNNTLTAANISKDGPEFNNAKESINKIKNIEATTNLKYETLTSNEYIVNKSNQLNLDNYYTNLFISLINENLKVKEDTAKIREITESYNTWITKIEDVLNFLTKNKENWKVSGNTIMFTSNELVTNYNTLLSNLKKQESLLKLKLTSLKF